MNARHREGRGGGPGGLLSRRNAPGASQAHGNSHYRDLDMSQEESTLQSQPDLGRNAMNRKLVKEWTR